MSDQPEIPKLRLAPQETAEELLRRMEREQRAWGVQREMDLEQSLAPFKVGSVPYLNTAPLTRGIDDQILFVPPSRLAEMLRSGEIDAGLVSITAALFDDRYDILDGMCIASLGEVYSVFLAHRAPIEQAKVIEYDPASLASITLLRLLLAERGLFPEFKPLNRRPEDADYVMLIGNPAIDFRRSRPPHEIWDLGAAWYELTSLPFVFAVWALRRDKDTQRLRQLLREARDFGMDTLDYIIDHRPEYDREFRRDYLGWHIHYHMGADEKRGVERFIGMLRKHNWRAVYPPRYIV